MVFDVVIFRHHITANSFSHLSQTTFRHHTTANSFSHLSQTLYRLILPSPSDISLLRTHIPFSEVTISVTHFPVSFSPFLRFSVSPFSVLRPLLTLWLLSIFRSRMTRYYGSASRYLGPYSYYLLLSIDLPRLLLPRVILVTDFRRQSPFVIDRSLCPWGTSSSPDIDTRPLSIFIYSLLLRIKVLCTPLYFLSSNIDLILLVSLRTWVSSLVNFSVVLLSLSTLWDSSYS